MSEEIRSIVQLLLDTASSASLCGIFVIYWKLSAKSIKDINDKIDEVKDER